MFIVYYGQYELGSFSDLHSAYAFMASELGKAKRRLSMFVIVDAFNNIQLKPSRG